VFYGSGPDDPASIARITAPVYGFYGGNDARVNATIPRTTELMKAAGKTYAATIYEGAGHGFMRAGEAPDASEANRKARDAAWKRWTELIRGHATRERRGDAPSAVLGQPISAASDSASALLYCSLKRF